MMKWKSKKLSELCDFGNGLWTGKKPPFQKVGVIRNTNFTKDGKLDDTDIVYLDAEQSQFEKRKLQYGDIILEKSGGGPKQPVGRVIVFDKTDGDFSFSNFTSVIRIKNFNEVDFTYLHRFLFFAYVSGATETMQSHSTGIRNLKFDEYKNLEIPLPPLPEQQRIVSILDECFVAIDKAKANAEQNLKNAAALFESYLQGVFENGNWDKKTLQDVAKVFGRGKSKHRPRNWEGLYGGEYPFIQTGEVRNANKFIRNYSQTYNEVGLSQSKLWKKGTICITIAANIAETAILDFAACIPDSIIGFEVDEKKADLNFAYYLLQYFKAELQKLGKGSAQDNINLGTFENQFFPFPSLKEQQTIVRQLDALRAETQKLEAIYQQKLLNLEELKKSVLQKAFAGELKT
jgi:type I restriction enzyme S subunit